MSAQPQRICTSVCESVVPRCEHHLVMVVKMVVSNEAFPHLYQFLLTVTSLMVSDQLIQSSSAVVIKVMNETRRCDWSAGDSLPGKERLCGSPGPRGPSG